MLVSFLAAAVGCVLTGTQAVLIYLDGSGICLDEGCEIVDSLTRVEPIYFNIFGFLFFLIVCFSLSRARKGSDIWKRFVGLLLLAALAAEGVLFSFQLFITEVYCSYCLIVLALVFLCNLFMGLKQLFKGLVIFTAVFAAMASLQFNSTSGARESLDDGTLARFGVATPDRKLYLFFSSSCVYCENVIESIKEHNTCSINFNPIDTIETFSFPGATLTASHTPEINRDYLRDLDVRGVPVFIEKRKNSITVLRGESAITGYLEQNCSDSPVETNILPPDQMSQTSSSDPFSSAPPEDGCFTPEDCEEPKEESSVIGELLFPELTPSARSMPPPLD